MFRKMIAMLGILCLAVGACFAEENPSPMIGEWAYEIEPEKLVLRVSEDGTAWYRDTECEWEDMGDALRLTDQEGVEMHLRYLIMDGKTVIYPSTVYRRQQDVEDQGGLIGIWEEIDGGGSYVFTPAGAFLEDNSFSGTFMLDDDAGTFLLHYGDTFADTLCYYSIDQDEQLTVEYPWPVTALQNP